MMTGTPQWGRITRPTTMRNIPNQDGIPGGVLGPGTHVVVLGPYDDELGEQIPEGWVQIGFNGRTAYVTADSVELE